MIEQGPRFGDIRIMAPESFNFSRQHTDPLLNNAQAAAQFDIVAGHIYGGGLAGYPLARQRGKEVWMTEHSTNQDDANVGPSALGVGSELNASMRANFNAYVWWYIRRFYGLITDDGQVSKRGYLMSQYARFVRPGFVRVGASDPQGAAGVQVTAFKNGPREVVVVALNTATQARNANLDVFGSCVTSFDRFTTSQTKNALRGARERSRCGRARRPEPDHRRGPRRALSSPRGAARRVAAARVAHHERRERRALQHPSATRRPQRDGPGGGPASARSHAAHCPTPGAGNEQYGRERSSA